MASDDEWTVGENLAWGTDSLSSPGAIMAAWMASPGHRTNILTADYREIGIGAVAGVPADHTTGVTSRRISAPSALSQAQAVPAQRTAKHASARMASSKRRACLRAATTRQRLAGHCSATALRRRARASSAATRRNAARRTAGATGRAALAQGRDWTRTG